MRKYNSYMVKVITNGMELEVKTSKNKSDYSEMMKLYHETKASIKEGKIQFMGVNLDGETEIFSIQKEDKKEIDVLVDSVIDALTKIQKYSENSSTLEGLINSTRDGNLKQIELFSNLELDEEEAVLEKVKIFDEIQELLKLRRTLKYQNIMSNKICCQLNVDNIIKVLKSVRKEALKKPSIDLANSKPILKETVDIDSVFNVEHFPLINDFVEKYDKVYISENQVQGANRRSKEEAKTSIEPKEKSKNQVQGANRRSKEEEVKPSIEPKEKPKSKKDKVSDELDLEGVIYIGKSFDKLKGNKALVDKFEFMNLTAKSDETIIKEYNKNYNVITKNGEKICCYKYVQEYAGYGVVQKQQTTSLKAKLKLAKKYARVEVVDNMLYCLQKTVTL